MRSYRFVDFLGSAVAEAGEVVADAAHVEFDHSGGLAAKGDDTPGERVGQELLRQVARATDTTEVGAVEFTARALAPVRPEKRATPGPGGDLGVIFQIDVPGYRYSSAITAKSLYASSFGGIDTEVGGEKIRDDIEAMADTTPAFYLFLVAERGIRVFSGHGAAGIQDPLTKEALTDVLYPKSFGRFVEEFAEGFLGDPGLIDTFRYPERTDDLDQELRAWAAEYELQGVLLVRVSRAPNQEPASLRDFY